MLNIYFLFGDVIIENWSYGMGLCLCIGVNQWILVPEGQGKKLENIGQDCQLLKLLFWKPFCRLQWSLNCWLAPSIINQEKELTSEMKKHYPLLYYFLQNHVEKIGGILLVWILLCVFILFFYFFSFSLFYFKFYMLGDLLFSRIIICFSIGSEVFDSRSFGKRNML